MLNPSLRPVEARVYTDEFRVYGVFHLRTNTGTAWLLNADDRPHLPLTHVSMFRPGVAHPPGSEELSYETHFAAIPKASIVWMQGGAPDPGQDGMGRHPRQVFLVYPTYVVTGTFQIRPEVRLSDYIGTAMAAKPFVTLHAARILGKGTKGQSFTELPTIQSHDFITVNLRNVGGIFDLRGGDPAKAYVAEE